jgi:hypothetical protein
MRGPTPQGQTQVTRYRRHAATGKIVPLSFRADVASTTKMPEGEFYFSKQVTPHVMALYDTDLAMRATEFAKDIMMIWMVAAMAISAIQIYSAVQIAALRAASAARIATATAAAAYRAEAQQILMQAERKALIAEIRAAGVKFTESRIVVIFRTAAGKLVWLERGDAAAGLEHIMARHGSQFAGLGVKSEAEVVELIQHTLSTKLPVRILPRGGQVFSVMMGGAEREMNIAVGSNGFIVTAHPL